MSTYIEDEVLYLDSTPEIKNPFDPKLVDIVTQTMVISNIVERLKYDEFTLHPVFQRNAGLWSDEKQSRLIESLMIKIPIPSFYFDNTEQDKLIVIDGLQRLWSIKRFMALENGDPNQLRLKGLEYLNQFEGKTFDELPRTMQRRIKEQSITAYIIRQGTPDAIRTSIFKRINTGGMSLTPAEIRNAVYQGKASEFLKRLSTSDEFKTATNRKIPPERMLDREFVNRTMAFVILGYEKYSGNMDQYLEDVLARIKALSDEKLSVYEDAFLGAMKTINVLFKDKAFRKPKKEKGYGKINKPLYEVVSVAFTELTSVERQTILNRKEAFLKKYHSLFQDDSFVAAISSATAKVQNAKTRYKLMREVILETLKND